MIVALRQMSGCQPGGTELEPPVAGTAAFTQERSAALRLPAGHESAAAANTDAVQAVALARKLAARSFV